MSQESVYKIIKEARKPINIDDIQKNLSISKKVIYTSISKLLKYRYIVYEERYIKKGYKSILIRYYSINGIK